jgi:hypothetical protein
MNTEDFVPVPQFGTKSNMWIHISVKQSNYRIIGGFFNYKGLGASHER